MGLKKTRALTSRKISVESCSCCCHYIEEKDLDCHVVWVNWSQIVI